MPRLRYLYNIGVNFCVYCLEEFTLANPCWNSDSTFDDGTHEGGECMNCAAKHGNISAIKAQTRAEDGLAIANGQLERN